MRALAAVLGGLVLAACGQDQGRLPCADGYCVLGWTATCRAAGTDLRCDLFDQQWTDVTAEGGWSVSGPAMVDAQGSIRATGRGDVVIAVSHRRIGIGTIEAGRFRVDPPGRPRRFWWLAGSVEQASDQKALAGVLVTIVDEHDEARSALTNAHGQFRLEPVLTYEDYRWIAEKPGYVTRWGRFHLPDPTGGVEPVPYSAPALSRLDLRLVPEPLRNPSGG